MRQLHERGIAQIDTLLEPRLRNAYLVDQISRNNKLQSELREGVVSIASLSEELSAKISQQWPTNGLEASTHNLLLLERIEELYGSEAVTINGGRVPHNSMVYKYWRNRVAPTIQDSGFTLHFAAQDQRRVVIAAETDRALRSEQAMSGAESRVGPATTVSAQAGTQGVVQGAEREAARVSHAATLGVEAEHLQMEGFHDVSDLFGQAELDPSLDLHSEKIRFLAPNIHNPETGASTVRVLAFSSAEFNVHKVAAINFSEQHFEIEDLTGLDFEMAAMGYIKFDTEISADGARRITALTIQNVGGDASVQRSFNEQARSVIDSLVESGVPISAETEIYVTQSWGGTSYQANGATYQNVLASE